MTSMEDLIFEKHTYEGVLYPNIVTDSAIEELKIFDVRPDDVWIVTYPRSGTHWMSEIVGLIHTDGYPEKIDRSLTTSWVSMIDMSQRFPETRAEEVDNPVDMTPHLESIRRAPSPRTILSHLRLGALPPNLTKRARVIYVARNPKDVINSNYNLVKSYTSNVAWDALLQSFTGGMMTWGPWPDHVTPFWNENRNGDMLFMFYEDMKKDLPSCITKVAEFIERPLSDEAFSRVLEGSSLSGMGKTYDEIAKTLSGAGKPDHFTKWMGKIPFINNGLCGQWKTRFTVAQSEEFDEWYNEKMAGTNLNFVYE